MGPFWYKTLFNINKDMVHWCLGIGQNGKNQLLLNGYSQGSRFAKANGVNSVVRTVMILIKQETSKPLC